MSESMIDARELHRWMEEQRAFVLIDVLPTDAHEELRLPRARPACVYEVTFLEQVESHAPDRETPLVVHCSGPDSLACVDAAVRLDAAGYSSVHLFRGGRRAWIDAGYPVEGSGAAGGWLPDPPAALLDGILEVHVESSGVDWAGRNLGGRHFGSLAVGGGRVKVEGGIVVSGSIAIDMRSIRVGDLSGDHARLLVQHLESDDFFAVAQYPEARFEIHALERVAGATPGVPDHRARGALTLRGITNEIAFLAQVAPHKEGGVLLQSQLELDRTLWGVNYGSGKLYHRLGMHLVNDHISAQVRVVAR
jgi:polyisoprenoid-binding protein YceI/rhodanese-related sulfurtransferase